MKKSVLFVLTIALVLSLTACKGCGKRGSREINPSELEKTAPEDYYDLNVEDGENTVVLEEKGGTFVYTHDGEKVTSCRIFVDCGNSETAKDSALSMDLSDEAYVSQGIQSVTSLGRYLVLTVSEEHFPYKTYKELSRAK